jgi:metal-dependent hydrolase (beta-lactamase superfamily II)
VPFVAALLDVVVINGSRVAVVVGGFHRTTAGATALPNGHRAWPTSVPWV